MQLNDFERGVIVGMRYSQAVVQTDSFAAEGGTGGKTESQPPRVSPALAKLLDDAASVVSWSKAGNTFSPFEPNSLIGTLAESLDALAKESSVCEQRR